MGRWREAMELAKIPSVRYRERDSMAKAAKNQPKKMSSTTGPFRAWFGSDRHPRYLEAVLAKKGAEVFVVGGAVRDALLGRTAKRDLDLVVRGVPLAALTRLLKLFGRVDEVGRVFGVIKFIPRGQQGQQAIDIALPRTEFAFGTGGYKDVETKSRHTLSLEADLARRDFTVNAMAWNLATSQLVDPYAGERDLSKKILRAVGDPVTRFQEDYTRILRLLRFSLELDFSIHAATWSAAKKLVIHLNDQRAGQWVLPRELVAKELLKSCAANPAETLLLWDRVGAWRVLIPELLAMKRVAQPPQYHTEGDVWQHTQLALRVLMGKAFAKQFPEGWDVETALGVLFHDIGKPPTVKTPEKHGTDRIRFDGHDVAGARMTRAIADRLALSSYKSSGIDVSSDRLEWVVAHHLLMVNADANELRPQTIERYFFSPKNPGTVLRKVMFCDTGATINADGKAFWKSFRALEKRIAAIAKMRSLSGEIPKPLLTGDAIMKTFHLSPGPQIGMLLTALRDAQLSGKVRSKDDARAFLKKRFRL